jgi:hypothetical protein
MTILFEASHSVRPLTRSAFDRYLDYYANVVLPAMRRHGMEMIGAWKRTGGELNRDVMLFRFESMGHYERAAAAIRTDPAFAASRASIAGDFQVAETKKLAVHTSYSNDECFERLLRERPDEPRQYLQAILNAVPGKMPQACVVIAGLAQGMESRGWSRLAAGYETLVPTANEVTDIWALPRPTLNLAYRPGRDPLAEWAEPLREFAPDEWTYYLNPLPFSPLQ